MASNPAISFPMGRENARQPRNPVQECPDKSSDITHELMTKAEEQAETREAIHALALSATVMNKAMTHVLEEHTSSTQKQAPWWLSPIATVCGVVVAVFGVQFTSTGSADLRHQVGLHDYQLKERLESERQISDRLMSMEFIFARVRQDLAAYGLQVDPQSGAITLLREKKGR